MWVDVLLYARHLDTGISGSQSIYLYIVLFGVSANNRQILKRLCNNSLDGVEL